MKIIETFLSIQGEGINSGLPTFFIRLMGCNLRCSYCDTKYSFTGGYDLTVDEIISLVLKQGKKFKLICITGGEPLIQVETKKLINALLKKGYKIDIETNGSILINKFPNSKNILFSLDIKCPSSGMSKKMKFANLKLLKHKDQVKFIIANHKDFIYSKKIVTKFKLPQKTNVIFSPVGGIKADKLTKWILKEQLNIRIGLQIHKVIWQSNKEETRLFNN